MSIGSAYPRAHEIVHRDNRRKEWYALFARSERASQGVYIICNNR